MVAKTISKKKKHETVNNELMTSMRENDAEQDPGLNIANVIDTGEAIIIISCYEELIKTQNKRVIRYVAKQGHIMKKFRDRRMFHLKNVENVG